MPTRKGLLPARGRPTRPPQAEVQLANCAGVGVAAHALELCHGSAGGGAYSLKGAGARVVGGCELVGSRWLQYCKLHPCNNTKCMDVVGFVSGWTTGCALCLLTAPCQCFMTLGGHTPLGGSDPRECNLPVAKALAALPRNCLPSTIVVENVCSFRTHGGGALFDEFADTLFGMGYEMVMLEMHAERFGLPIRRQRLYVVALPNMGAWQRFMGQLPAATSTAADVHFSSIASKDVSLWDEESLAVPLHAVEKAMGRSSLGWFTFASCHYTGILQTLITKGGDQVCLGYGTYVLLTPDTDFFRHNTLSFEQVLSRGWPVRLLTCKELCLLQGCPVDTTLVHGEGKGAHTAWGEAVAVPCCKAACIAALQASGYATSMGGQHPSAQGGANAWVPPLKGGWVPVGKNRRKVWLHTP